MGPEFATTHCLCFCFDKYIFILIDLHNIVKIHWSYLLSVHQVYYYDVINVFLPYSRSRDVSSVPANGRRLAGAAAEREDSSRAAHVEQAV